MVTRSRRDEVNESGAKYSNANCYICKGPYLNEAIEIEDEYRVALISGICGKCLNLLLGE